jgi:hypothetical protein
VTLSVPARPSIALTVPATPPTVTLVSAAVEKAWPVKATTLPAKPSGGVGPLAIASGRYCSASTSTSSPAALVTAMSPRMPGLGGAGGWIVSDPTRPGTSVTIVAGWPSTVTPIDAGSPTAAMVTFGPPNQLAAGVTSPSRSDAPYTTCARPVSRRATPVGSWALGSEAAPGAPTATSTSPSPFTSPEASAKPA